MNEFNSYQDQELADKIMRAQFKALTLYDANNTCLSVDECAEFLNLHRRTIVSQIHSGNIKANLIGRIWKIPKVQFLEKISETLNNNLDIHL